MKSRIFAFLFLLAGTLFCACGNAENAKNEIEFAGTQIELSNGMQIFVEIADTDEKRSRGLQNRKNLPENHGMLFVYPTGNRRVFWMKDTPMDLSIAYFDSAGTLVEIYEMRANSERSVFSNSADIKYALEMPAGWFKKNGISAGTVFLKF